MNKNNNFTKKWVIPKKSLVFLFIFFLLFFISPVFINSSLNSFGIDIFFERIKAIFSFKNEIKEYPNESLFFLSIKFLITTIKLALIGTLIGFMMALISSTLSNSKITNNKIFSSSFNFIFIILRIIPTIFFIYIFSNSFSSEISLILFYLWFSWIWCHKYILEYYKSINYDCFINRKFYSNSKLIFWFKYLMPQINSKLLSLFLFSFESNIRWSSILGILGMPGIGQLILLAQNNQYESMGIPIITLSIFIVIFELFTNLFNRKILNKKDYNFLIDFKNMKINQNKIIIYLFLFFISFLFFLSLFYVDWNGTTFFKNNILVDFFNPNWSIINEINFNFYFEFFLLVIQSIQIMGIGFFIALFFLFFSCKFIFKRSYLVNYVLNVIIRSIPEVLIFLLINPLFNTPLFSIVIVVGINIGCTLSKNLYEPMNSIPDKNIQYVSYSFENKLILFKKYILSYLRNDFINIFFFFWEVVFLTLITYGMYGCSKIGLLIDTFYNSNHKEFYNMATFVWISFFINFINFVLFSYIKKILNKKYFFNIK